MMLSKRDAQWLTAALVSTLVIAGCGDDTTTGGGGGDGSGGSLIGSNEVGNDGDVVGGPCETNSECDSGSECLDEGDFPGGTCTVVCESDDECPDGTRCISSEGGVCLLECDTSADCRDGYECDDKSLEDGDGDTRVCA